ncbi:MAG: M36 family metallopeptidase [Acidobacteria bacterium]|nr:M36 family metallopeptidase [Acidobacteriota bacterium]
MFYLTNTYHDAVYRLGFTEAAGNFQDSNYRRGGLGGDRISAQAQDCSGTNNANFSTPADGTRPQMQMYLFTAPTPNFDGSFDADIVFHENTHGLSNRLHGNTAGLVNDLARGMGEGWSDFYAHCLLSRPGDPIDGIYPAAPYISYRFTSAGTTVGFNNYYYGIRRFPTAILAAKGGSQNRPHDPLTFADMDSTKIDLSDGAFPPRFSISNADEVHNIGEVWDSMLWEIRAKFITRLGWAEGNRRILQIVTDGMKLAPINPTPLSERDAMLAAAQVDGTGADLNDIWAGFAVRGLGSSASIQNVGGSSAAGGTNTVRVTEAFDSNANLLQSPDISVSDDIGDGDGYTEPGEKIRISVPITNLTDKTAKLVTARIGSDSPVSYRNIQNGATVSRDIVFTVPAAAACGSVLPITININSSLGPVSFTRQFFVGRAAQTVTSENFDGVTAPAFPTGWTATSVSGGTNFVTTTTTPDTAPNSAFALDPTSVGGGTDLTSPPIDVSSMSASPVAPLLTFRHKYATENGWDGGALEISISGGAYQDILKAGGSFVQGGYNGTLGGGGNNPLAGRAAWTGNSNGYVTTIVSLPPTAQGHIIQLRWRFGADDNTAVTGWNVDTISLTNAGFVTSFGCSARPANVARPASDLIRDPLILHKKVSPVIE